MKTFNKKFATKFFAVIIAVLMLTAYFSFVSFNTSFADEEANTAYVKSSVEIANGQFAESGNEEIPLPSSWTSEGAAGGVAHGVVDFGNFTETNLKDVYKLRATDEFANEAPQTLFGRNTSDPLKDYYYPGTNKKALMINAGISETVFGYKSNTISLTKNSYYRICVWAKTGNNTNAHIKLSANNESNFKNEVSFDNINTVGKNGGNYNGDGNRNFGWIKYSFYIETSTLYDSSVSLSLQLGNNSTYTDDNGDEQIDTDRSYNSKGYAFFDNATVYRYSPDLFDKEIESFNKENGHPIAIKSDNKRHLYANDDGTSLYYSENDSVYLSVDPDANEVLGLGSETAETTARYEQHVVGSFDQHRSDNRYWKAAKNSAQQEPGASMNFGVYNSIVAESGIKAESDIPYAPNGSENMIAFLSSYNAVSKRYDSACFGYSTPDFTLMRHKYYKLSVWVKTINGDVANIVVAGEDYRGGSQESDRLGENQLYASSGLTGSSGGGDDARNGWTEVSFFIEGSSFADYNIHIELWLGIGRAYDNSGAEIAQQDAAGTAMFDNLCIEELTSTEFSNYSGSGTTVNFDAAVTESGFANSTFSKIADYTQFAYPFEPKSWTYTEVNENTTTGMSTDRVKGNSTNGLFDQDFWDNSVVRGIIPTDDVTFNKFRDDAGGKNLFGGLVTCPGVSDHMEQTYGNGGNALLIASDKQVAVGYASSTVAITAGKQYTIDVAMKTENMNGYGANLVLKKGNNIIATIEGIGVKVNTSNDAGWQTYSFYVEGGDSDIGDVTLEIWLGLYDERDNTTKLSSGRIVIDRVNFTEHEGTAGGFVQKNLDYINGRGDGTYATYSFKQYDFDYFDRYPSDSDDTIKKSYNYSMSSPTDKTEAAFGAFDSFSINEKSYLWPGYDNKGTQSKHKLYLQNKIPAYSKVESNFNKTVTGNLYYKLSISMKVNIPLGLESSNANYKGAYVGIKANGEEQIISDIKSTALVNNIYDPSSADNEYFREYNFYIQGTEEEDSSDNISVIFGLGGARENERSRGTVVIDRISFTECSDTEYSNVKGEIEAGETGLARTAMTFSFAKEETEEEERSPSSSSNLSSTESWLMISAIILVIAIIVAVVAFAVRYSARKRKASIDPRNVKSYDRKATLLLQHNRRAMEKGDTISSGIDTYDLFDEALEDDQRKEELERRLNEEELAESTPAEEMPAEENAVTKEKSAEPIIQEITAEAQPEKTQDEGAENTDAGEPDAINENEVSANEENAEAADTEEIDYNEVIDFSKRKFTKITKKEETLEQAIERVKKQKEIDDDAQPGRYNDWDDFDD